MVALEWHHARGYLEPRGRHKHCTSESVAPLSLCPPVPKWWWFIVVVPLVLLVVLLLSLLSTMAHIMIRDKWPELHVPWWFSSKHTQYQLFMNYPEHVINTLLGVALGGGRGGHITNHSKIVELSELAPHPTARTTGKLS